MMRSDLLHIYAKNHRAKIDYFIVVFFAFLLLRFSLYGSPDLIEFIAGLLLLAFSCCFSIKLQILYRDMLIGKKPFRKNFNRTVITIAACKACSIIPLLLILFWPLHTDLFYNHILGYLYIFFLIALYTPASAAYLPLLVWDTGMILLFAAGIVIANLSVQETPYAGLAILLLSFYTIMIGRKINQSTIELVDNKYDLRKAVQEAQKAHQAKTDFLAVMSHEIRTPLNGIMGMIDFLEETALDREQKECLNTITSCSTTLLNTLNDVLDISKIEAGKYKITKVNFDLRVLLGSAISMAEHIARDKGNRVSLQIDPAVPAIIHNDPDRLRQVINNLLNNAVKFTDNGTITLCASYKPVSNIIRIEVRDTGIGISAEDQGKLFREFSQIESGVSRHYGGTGLGLSIAAKLMSLLGGNIGVLSNKGEGSVFWLEVPYAKAAQKGKSTEKSEKTPSNQKLKILLIDDNGLNQKIVARYLRNKGHDVSIAHNGQEGIDCLKKETFDLILMDLHMPGMDGLETTRAIKKMGTPHHDIPVIALTANAMEGQIRKCREAGMIDHIVKPIDKKSFYRTIAKYAGKTFPEPGSHSIRLDPEPGGLNSKIASIYEEFGPDYALSFIKDSLNDVEKKLAGIEGALIAGDYFRAADIAHDLVTASGNIGMDRTAALARTIETAETEGRHDEMHALFQEMKNALHQEAEPLKQIKA